MGKYAMTKNARRFRENALDYDWNDYRSMQELSQVPVIGRLGQARMRVLEFEENEQWWNDYFKNTGLNRNSNRYPIRSGYYGNYAGIGDYFEASESVVSLFDSRLMRWL